MTGFLRDTLLQPEYTPGKSQPEMADILSEDFTSALDINNLAEPGFEMVTAVGLHCTLKRGRLLIYLVFVVSVIIIVG